MSKKSSTFAAILYVFLPKYRHPLTNLIILYSFMKKFFTLLFAALALCANTWAANIGEWTSNQCNVTLSDAGVLTISRHISQGQMANYTVANPAPWDDVRASITSAVIESGVSQIGARVFLDCENMTSVTIAGSVTSIGNAAFRGCTGLSSITIPESVTTIGEAALYGCSGLTTLEIPANVANIGKGAFSYCEGLTSIICHVVTPVVLPSEEVFRNVSKSIPLYVPFESLDAYIAAAQWGEFNVMPDPNQCHTYGYCGAEGDGKNIMWTFDCDAKMLVISGTGNMASYTEGTAPWYIHRTKINTVVIEEGVKTIGGYAFYLCRNITSLTLPNSLLSIGSCAFNGCNNGLTELIIPSAVATIGAYAFANCSGIATIRILGRPTIEDAAFKSCSALTSIMCASEIPPTCNGNPFLNLTDEKLGTITLIVPGTAIDDYVSNAVWTKFNIQASAQKTVRFVDENGTVLKTQVLAVGAWPNADDLTPTKEADDDYVYEFVGWLPTIVQVEHECNYVTHFVRTPKQFFNVGIGGANCALNVTNKVPEGTYLKVTVAPEDCYQFTQWSDGDNNNPRIIQVTEDTNISADCTKIIYTIEGQAQGSGVVTIAPKQ